MTRHTKQTRELLDLPPPANIAAEKAVLGSILVSNTPNAVYERVAEVLSPRDFYSEPNRIAFEHMRKLRREHKPIDSLMLAESLKSATAHDVKAYDEVGGFEYLTAVITGVVNHDHASYHASIVREAADKRRLFDLGLMTAQASCFDVLRPVRTAFMGGESGLPTLKETFRRIARAAGRELRDATDLIISDELPQLGSPEHMTALRRFIEKDGIKLLIIDPLYLCADTDGCEGSLFAMGALLRSVAKVATDCGTTLKILHHMTQTSAKTSADRNPELFDSAWAGTQQFFRQWIAINRRSPYDPERPGHHELRLVTGGSMGHATGVALDIEEGKVTDPDGRRWDVTVRSLAEVRVERQTAGNTEKVQLRELKFEADCELARRKLAAIYPNGTTKSDLKARCQLSGDRINAVIVELGDHGVTEPFDVQVSNHKKSHKGIRLKKATNDLFAPE